MSKFNEISSIKESIREIKKALPYSKVSMKGFYEDLVKIKQKVEILYDEDIFFLGYPLDDAPFHGWDGEKIKEMRKIDKEICKKFEEIYAIILCGLDEDI